MADETTKLTAAQEPRFRQWLVNNHVRDLDHPDSHYDYRGAFLAGVGRGPGEYGHFPDTFKQHGHPTFSEESQYSKGPGDGGTWNGETFIPAKQAKPMGDASYKNIDFERMLSDLGAALERNKAEPGTLPAPKAYAQPQTAADVPPSPYPTPVQPGGVPTARFPDVSPGASPMAQQAPPMTVTGAAPPPPAYSPQDQQTLAELNAATPGAMQFGAGIAPHPAHAPPPAVAAQLAGIAQQPTAASAPPTVYPNIDPQAAGGLAGYSAMNR